MLPVGHFKIELRLQNGAVLVLFACYWVLSYLYKLLEKIRLEVMATQRSKSGLFNTYFSANWFLQC